MIMRECNAAQYDYYYFGFASYKALTTSTQLNMLCVARAIKCARRHPIARDAIELKDEAGHEKEPEVVAH